MAKRRKPTLEGEFKHGTSVGSNGEILYDCPIQIKDRQDLANYGITWDDCKTLHFGTSESMTVYYLKVENRAFAESQWTYLDNLHSRGYASVRCMVPGKKKAFIKCPDTNSCTRCPYGRKPEDKEAPVISWDGLIETGYDPGAYNSTEEQVQAKMEYAYIRSLWDKEDPRIAQAFEAKELYGYKVEEIAPMLKVSEPRVYQLIARAKAIGKEYRRNNG